jgi:hypothetical protein
MFVIAVFLFIAKKHHSQGIEKVILSTYQNWLQDLHPHYLEINLSHREEEMNDLLKIRTDFLTLRFAEKDNVNWNEVHSFDKRNLIKTFLADKNFSPFSVKIVREV